MKKERIDMSCLSCEQDNIQTFPNDGILQANLNLHASKLRKLLKKDSATKLFVYSLHSVKIENSMFIQRGTAPNYQGDIITLCTCMHRMRTKITNPEDWEGVWICGIKKPNHLFYLMKVKKAYNSMSDIFWGIDKKAVLAKNASSHILGDIYEPKSKALSLKEKVNPRFYQKPIEGHPHGENKEWHKDIMNYNNHSVLYLEGDPQNSFLWSKPLVNFNFTIYPGWKSIAVGEFSLNFQYFLKVLEHN